MGPLAGASVLALLGEYAVKSTIVLVLALAAARIAAAKTASFRHFVLSLALLSLLVLPLVSLVPFGWETKASRAERRRRRGHPGSGLGRSFRTAEQPLSRPAGRIAEAGREARTRSEAGARIRPPRSSPRSGRPARRSSFSGSPRDSSERAA